MVDKYVRRQDHSARNGGDAFTFTEYVYDIGEHPVKQDMLERFRKMYPASNNEYQDHAFKANIDGKEKQIRIPTEIVREIHLRCEAEQHPITFYQKLQPNYQQGQRNAPNKIGKMTVQNVSYWNSVQSSMGCPNYYRQKAWALQKEVFDTDLKYRRINDKDYPHISDLDYSEGVMKRTLFPEQYEKSRRRPGKGSKEKTEPLSKLARDKDRLSQVCKALPHSTEYAETEEEGFDDMDESGSDIGNEDKDLDARNNRRTANGQIRKVNRSKQARRSTQNEERSERMTRSMEKARQAKSQAVRRKSDPGGRGSKRKKLEMNATELEEGEILETVAGSENTFDLFSSDEPKRDWDEHPKMAGLLKTGKTKLEKIGFSSPNAGTGNVTMHQIARAHHIKLPKKRTEAEPILLRALAIVRIKQLESDASDKYEDTKVASK